MPDMQKKPASSGGAEVIRVENFHAAFSGRTVIKDVNFTVNAGEIVVIAGGSGCGKSVTMKHMIGLFKPAGGRIFINGQNVEEARGEARRALLRSMGVMYQSGALFGSLTLLENVRVPLEEFTKLSADAMEAICLSKLKLVGLEKAADRLPSEISGGMQKRAAIARALALDPKIVFLDEPSAGLDPLMSAELDRLILDLRSLMGITFIVVTHELASIFTIADRCVVLDAARKTMVADDSPQNLLKHPDDPWIRSFFSRGEGDNTKPEAGA
ncbi:MAG: ATP-binding cassette domain-containing protein [Phycisphaeraceae bacterium]|nr:MAG: ATP-binding cassette domain-containing protein [Phycisphaeraceae bacterium]